jgi:ABC-type sugar transport system substrate-binding protein
MVVWSAGAEVAPGALVAMMVAGAFDDVPGVTADVAPGVVPGALPGDAD